MKIKPDKIYRVYWYDIQGTSHERFNKPLIEYCAKCWTVGRIIQDDKAMVVIYGENEDGEYCGDAIPLNCVYNIEELK